MTNEIKEKIEYLKKVAGIYEGARITEIEDYITNLQEENEIYKKIYNELLKQASKDSIWCKIILDKLQELKEKDKYQEIPLFEGTIEQLDNLTILKEEGKNE